VFVTQLDATHLDALAFGRHLCAQNVNQSLMGFFRPTNDAML